jgi:hypothetical protein
VEPDDRPFASSGNVATAGGCLAALYLVGWVVERLFGTEKMLETLRPVLPAGQYGIYEELVASSIEQGVGAGGTQSCGR